MTNTEMKANEIIPNEVNSDTSINIYDNDSLMEYLDAVDYCAVHRQSKVIQNKGNDHALVVFMSIFKEAKENIYLYAENLDNSVTRSLGYLDSLQLFLKRKGTTLNVILSNWQEENLNAPVFDLFRKYKDKVTINDGMKIPHLLLKSNGEKINFCTADGSMYRFEYDIKERSARCNFNDGDFSMHLNGIFEQLRNKKEIQPIVIS